jgi:hypothetical protein
VLAQNQRLKSLPKIVTVFGAFLQLTNERSCGSLDPQSEAKASPLRKKLLAPNAKSRQSYARVILVADFGSPFLLASVKIRCYNWAIFMKHIRLTKDSGDAGRGDFLVALWKWRE